MKLREIVLGMSAVLAVAAPTNPQTASTTQNGPENGDLYAVYSAVIPKEVRHFAFRQYAIAQDTVTEGWQIPATGGGPVKGARDCVGVPTNEAQEYETAIADFERKNSSSEPLEKRFSLERPYLLLNEADVARFRTKLAAGSGFAPEDYQPDHRFDDASPLISVSRAGFSHRGNIAIVYVQHECGSLCAGGSLHVLRKQGGKWVEEKLVTCAWDS